MPGTHLWHTRITGSTSTVPRHEGHPGDGATMIFVEHDYLPCLCWCARTIVGIRQRELLDGKTRSCGLVTCVNPATDEQVLGFACSHAGYVTSTLITDYEQEGFGGDRKLHGMLQRARMRRDLYRRPAYQAPARTTLRKARARGRAASANVALRRDLVQGMWELGLRFSDIANHLGELPRYIVQADIQFLLRAHRIQRSHERINDPEKGAAK